MSSELSRSLLINTLWSFVGRFGYFAVALITNVILVRLLSPKEFGQVGIMMFFIMIASVLVESGLSGALVRKQNATEVDYSTIFIFNLIVSLMLMTLLMASSGFIADFYKDSELQSVLIASSFILLINALRITQAARLIKNLQFKKKAVYEFLAVLMASIIAIVLAFNGAGVWALVALQLSTAVILAVLLWIFVGPLNSYKFSPRSFKEFYKFGVNTTLASLLNTTFDNVYQLILGKYFSISQTGYFYQAKKLQEIPSSIFVTINSGVIFSTLSKLQNSPKEFNEIYQNVVRVFSVIVALISIIIFYYSEVIILILYGERWMDSAYYMQLLVIGSFFYVQEMFNRNIFKIFDQTEKILQLEVFKKAVQSCTIVYGLWTMSIENLLFGFILTNVISFIVNYYIARKVQSYFKWHDLFVLIKIIIIAVATTLVCYLFAQSYNLKGFYTLLLLPLLLFIYFLFLYLFKISNVYHDLKSLKASNKRRKKND